MSDRDELAQELFIADNEKQPREQSIIDWEWLAANERFLGRIEHYKTMADGAIAAGYSKPRTVTTVAELDALPVGAIVRDPKGFVYDKCRDDDEDISWWETTGDQRMYGGRHVALPAMVLHEPEAAK